MAPCHLDNGLYILLCVMIFVLAERFVDDKQGIGLVQS
jgi:hypothetical protein